MHSRKIISIIFFLILINLGHYAASVSYLNTGIKYFESEVVGGGHEICSHGISHVNTKDFDYDEALDLAEQSLALVEDNTEHTSRWGKTGLSLAYPYSRTNENVAKAAYDAGFRIGGNSNNVIQFCPNETNAPQDELAWMNICRFGGKVTLLETDIDKLHKAEETGALADCMHHQNDEIDHDFLQYLESKNNVWYATWGEVRSYYYHINNIDVIYNPQASNDAQKGYDVVYSGDDLRFWNVPVTLNFNISDYEIRDIRVREQSNNAQYRQIKNINASQRMEEGYKIDSDTSTMYVSILPEYTQIIISVDPISGKPNNLIFSGFSRWWNGLEWAVTVHVDDVTGIYRVLEKYENHNLPLTLMIMGEAMDPMIQLSIYIITISIVVPIIILKVYSSKKTRNLDSPSP
jgi:hypothetical protein